MFESANRTLIALGLLVAVPYAAHAVDGAIEINQASALRGRVTSTDLPGFPVSLDSAGHYVLTSNLDLPDENTDGVSFGAHNISLDLNGFQITCGSCNVSGAGSGVSALVGVADASVRNGTIQNMGADGIRLVGQRTRVEGVRSILNRGHGIRAGQSARIERSIAFLNLNDGIRASAHSVISESISAANFDRGIVANMGAVVQRNVSADNAKDGIQVDLGSILTANVSALNVGFGISALNSSITNNATVQNVTGGISAEDSAVIANVSTSNQVGLTASTPTTGYGNNVFAGNGVGAQVSGGLEVDSNVCGGDLVCP